MPHCTCSLSKLGLHRAYDTEIKRDRYPQGALNTHIKIQYEYLIIRFNIDVILFIISIISTIINNSYKLRNLVQVR